MPEIERTLAQLETSVKSVDSTTQTARLLHQLKGVVASLRLTEVADQCLAAEEMIIQGMYERLQGQVANIRQGLQWLKEWD